MAHRRPRGVQHEHVDAAADDLLSRHLRPAIERVREKLGHGSPNTIAPMLEIWFAGLPAGWVCLATMNPRVPLAQPSTAGWRTNFGSRLWKWARSRRGKPWMRRWRSCASRRRLWPNA